MAERLADYLDAVDTAVGVVHDAKQEMELFSPVGISFSICHGPRSPSSSSLERNLRMFGGFIALTAPLRRLVNESTEGAELSCSPHVRSVWPADDAALGALLKSPAIPGLTESLTVGKIPLLFGHGRPVVRRERDVLIVLGDDECLHYKHRSGSCPAA
jgi:hypothetical protein